MQSGSEVLMSNEPLDRRIFQCNADKGTGSGGPCQHLTSDLGKRYSGPRDLESFDCLQLELLAGRQEVEQGPRAEHLIIACSWAPVQAGGGQEGRSSHYFPLGCLFSIPRLKCTMRN